MSGEVILRFISEELAREGWPESIDFDYPLLETNALDSLGMLQLVGFIEDEFGVRIRDEELIPENFGSVRRIVRLVELKVA